MSPNGQSVNTDVNTIDLQTNGFQTLKSLITVVEALTQDTSFKYASAVLEEDTRLRKHIASQNEELTKLTNKIKELEAIKETTYREMFDVNEKEKKRHAEAVKSIDSLKAIIQEKEQIIAEQRNEIEELQQRLQNLEVSYKDEKEKVACANHDIDELQKTLKSKDVYIEELKTAGSKMKRGFTNLEKKYNDLQNENLHIEKTMQKDSARLHELEGYAASFCEDEEAALLDKFFSFWEFTSQAVVVHLKENIPPEYLQNHQAWRKLKMPSIMSHQVPLPQSNSDAAKQMRLAVFLAILARELNEHIFQPSYISLNENDLREILVALAVKDPKKESFCRAMLLSINPEKQAMILKKAVLWNAGSYFLDLLPPARYEEFRKSLEDVVERACETWKSIQYSKNRYEPDFEPLEWGDEEWDSFLFANSACTNQNQHANGDTDEALLTVFPRICRVESNACKAISFATVLTRSQCIDAEREQRRREPSSPRTTRVIPDRQRSRGMSISLGTVTDQNKTFLESADQSSG